MSVIKTINAVISILPKFFVWVYFQVENSTVLYTNQHLHCCRLFRNNLNIAIHQIISKNKFIKMQFIVAYLFEQ